MSFNRDILHRKFNEEYEKLNAEQRMAVDKIEGPVIVIAGPGTGKTQILAARIGRILLDTDTLPENLLCLTYTDAGSMAMRKRLISFIGSDAYKVNIYTFHAFCTDIIQDNLSYFEKNSLDPVSELEKIDLLRQLIDTLPKNHLLKRYRGDVYYEIKPLQSLFSTLKKEGWTSQWILERIDAYLNDLPNRDHFICKRATKDYKRGDIRTDRIEEETAKMEKLKASVLLFDTFQEMMRAHNRYDFDDMINWVIRAFEANQQLLVQYQEKYQYILVDEYQDTSGTQNSLVRLLVNYWDVPNIFVVGDDDQSIYRFQGANIENMQQFVDHYSNDLLKVVLVNNYRSTQPILDISKTLINNNQERLSNRVDDISKDLRSSNHKVKSITALPAIREYADHHQERIDVALRIQELIEDGVQPSRIGVIYKENKYGDELSKIFRFLKIPVYSKRNLNLFQIPLANKVIALLRYLAAEHDTPYGGDELLFEILHFDFFGIPPMEVAKLTMEVADKHFTESRTSLRRLLYEKSKQPPRDLFDKGMHPNLKAASRCMEQLIADVSNETLQVLFEHIIRKAGVLATVMKSDEKIWHMQVIIALFDFIKEETRRNPALTLSGLMNTIDLMLKNDLVLPLVQSSGNDKGVSLMTAHGSKGLEFEYVFVCATNAQFWEKKRKPSGYYKLPDTIFSSGAETNDEEELRRLFYVALTRAEKYLSISYANFREDGRGCEPSQFIAEILDEHPIKIEKIYLPDQLLMHFAAMQFTATAAPEIEKLEEEQIGSMLDKFVMNVTALNNYLNCPLEFYFRNLIRIPSPKNEATEFGSAVHYAIQRLFEKMKDHPKRQFGTKEDLIQEFNWYMHRHRESFTRQAYERRLEYGEQVLGNYYDRYVREWNKVVAIERNIKNVFIDDIPLKGKLDKLEFDHKDVNVVDYKTGDIGNATDKLKPPNDKNPLGGDYWRQAVFYKILVDHSGRNNWRVVSTEFDFVEPDKKKVYRKEKIYIMPEDIETVTQQIRSTWQKIQDREFYTGCGKPDCHWCNFVKTNELQVALHEVNAEEEVEGGTLPHL